MPRQNYLPSETELANRRRARRIKRDLGVNPAGVKVILHLREQVVALQAHVSQLQMELAIYEAQRQAHVVDAGDRFEAMSRLTSHRKRITEGPSKWR